MKWYPFWKIWYFSKEQKIGITVMIIIMLGVSVFKGYFTGSFLKSETDKLTALSEENWTKLQDQIDSSKALSAKEQEHPEANKRKSKSAEIRNKSKGYTPKQTFTEVLEVNSASADDFKQLKGIGDVLSKRLVKYRDKLGGFYDVNQILEVYGISDSIFDQFKNQLKADPKMLKKIKINQEEAEKLKEHPYISYKLARQIVNYREKIKPFETVEEVRNLYAINDSIYNKIFPYLVIY